MKTLELVGKGVVPDWDFFSQNFARGPYAKGDAYGVIMFRWPVTCHGVLNT